MTGVSEYTSFVRPLPLAARVYLLVLLIAILAGTAAGDEPPKCDYCGKPVVGNYTVYEGKDYHNSCYTDHIALRCELCGKIIDGEYIFDDWGHVVCAYHQEHIVQCWACGQMITEAGADTVYADGRHTCGACRAEAIFCPEKAQLVLAEVATAMNRLGINVDLETPLELVSADELKRLSGASTRDPYGLATGETRSWLHGILTDRRQQVYALYGCPRGLLMEVLAHELMHTWMYNRDRYGTNIALAEGSCEYASLLVLEKLDRERAERFLNHKLQDPDPNYGEGFRRVRDWVGEVGIATWLNYLNSHNEPPWE